MKLIILSIVSILLINFSQGASPQGKYIDWEQTYKGVIRITNSRYDSSCIGTLIHSEWILTSAVCALKGFQEEMRVLFEGSYSFNEAVHIKNIYIHSEFDVLNRENDIALLELASAADKTIRTFKIARTSSNLVAKKARVVQWSYSYYDGNQPRNIINITTPNKDATIVTKGIFDFDENNNNNHEIYGYLYYHNVVVINNDMCEKYPVHIDDQRLCTYQSIACEGDEGAPLITNDNNKLIGLVSVSDVQAAICNKCTCNCLMPVTTYTAVAEYRDWIAEVTDLLLL